MWKYCPTRTWNWEGQWVPQWLPEVLSKGRCGSSHTRTHEPFICLAHSSYWEARELHGTGTCRNSDKARNLKGKSGITGLALVILHSWQQPDKIPLSSSIFNQNFRHLYKCEIKEIRNIYSEQQQQKGKMRFCKMLSVTLINSGESPRPDFLFLNGFGSQKSF